jgi:hypothetical protein
LVATDQPWHGGQAFTVRALPQGAVDMSRDDDVVRTFNDYAQTFQTLEPRSVAAYFALPCMLIAPQGVRVMTKRTEVEALLEAMMSALKLRGYSRSALAEMKVSVVSDSTAFVSVDRVRYKADETELERLGETYTLRKAENDWKIVAAVIHDPGIVLGRA